jgi:hypothetical protein
VGPGSQFIPQGRDDEQPAGCRKYLTGACLVHAVQRHSAIIRGTTPFSSSYSNLTVCIPVGEQFLKSVSFMSSLTDQQRDAVGSVLEQETYAKGDIIVRQGDTADSLFVVKSGSCSAFRADKPGKKLGKEVARMTEGGVFGESALSTENAVRQASVVAAEDGTVMFKLNKSDVSALLTSHKHVLVEQVLAPSHWACVRCVCVFPRLRRSSQACSGSSRI